MTNALRALQALGDSTRRDIFERLARRPHAVVELADALPVSRPAVSQHLKVLKEAGLVVVRRNGARHVYHIDPKGVDMMRHYLDRLWDKSLASFKAVAEADEDYREIEKRRTICRVRNVQRSPKVTRQCKRNC